MDHCIYRMATCYTFQMKTYKCVLVLVNTVDPDEMPDDEIFHLGIHCLPKYALRSHYRLASVH